MLLVGIPGNMLVLVVMKSPRFRYKSYSHYLCTLAVFDSLVLVIKFLRRVDDMLHVATGSGILSTYNDAACKIHNFSEHLCFLMSSWIVLCMSIERFIAVNFPFKKDLLCKPRSAVTIIVVVFSVLSYTQVFRLVVIEKNEVDAMCIAPARYLHIYVIMHIYMYQLGLHFLLPALLTLICNMSILWKIRKLRHLVSKHGSTHSRRAHVNRHKTTGTLLLVSFTYIFTLLPLVLLSLVMHVAFLTNTPLAMTIHREANDVRLLLELFSEINYAANFYIYVMSGSQFRGELRSMLFRQPSTMSSGGPTEKLQVFNFRKSVTTV